jgi:hypothetical protein
MVVEECFLFVLLEVVSCLDSSTVVPFVMGVFHCLMADLRQLEEVFLMIGQHTVTTELELILHGEDQMYSVECFVECGHLAFVTAIELARPIVATSAYTIVKPGTVIADVIGALVAAGNIPFEGTRYHLRSV